MEKGKNISSELIRDDIGLAVRLLMKISDDLFKRVQPENIKTTSFQSHQILYTCKEELHKSYDHAVNAYGHIASAIELDAILNEMLAEEAEKAKHE